MLARTRGLESLLELVGPIRPEVREASACLGLIPSENILSKENVPPRKISAVDGYCLPKPDELPARYAIKGLLSAGQQAEPFEGMVALRVLTGAVLPENAWAIIPDEDVVMDRDELALEFQPRKNFIRPAGSLIAEGSLVAEKGRVLVPANISAMSSLDIMNIKVHPRPKAFIIATGDELVKPFTAHGNRPVASNLALVGSLAARFEAETTGTGIGPDNLKGLAEMMDNAGADIILTTGGTAKSEKDLTRQAALKAGFKMVFSGLAMRPGSGCFAAVRDGVPLIGLPGPPPAVMSCFMALAVPVLDRLRGMPGVGHRIINAVFKGGYNYSPDHEQLMPCVLRQDGNGLVAVNVKMGAMDGISSMIRASALAFIPAGRKPEDNGPVKVLCCQPLTFFEER